MRSVAIPLAALAACAALLLGARCGEADASASATASASSSTASTARSTPESDTSLLRRADHARILGSASAPLWVVEVSDFQCPYCKRWHDESYAAVKREYVDAGKVRLAYVNFPLPGHKNAWPAAEAAMCAAAQDKFWGMHDALFATQESWGELANPAPMFDSLALANGVDTAAFHGCLSRHLTRPMIQADIDRAEQSGVNSTPSFIVGGTMLRGAMPLKEFRGAVDAALAHAGPANSTPSP